MNNEALLLFAIQHFKENGGTEKPSLEQSGVSTTKVFLRNRIGNLLKEYELGWIVFMCEQQTKTANNEPPADSTSKTPKQRFSQNSNTEQGNIKESKGGLFGNKWFGLTVFGLACLALFFSSGTGRIMLSSFMPSNLLTSADTTTTPETSSAPAPSQASSPFAPKMQNQYKVVQSASGGYQSARGNYWCSADSDFISNSDFKAKLASGTKVISQGNEQDITIKDGYVTCYYITYIVEE